MSGTLRDATALLDRIVAAARAHPLLADVLAAIVAAVILRAIVPGAATVGIVLLVLALGAGAVRLLRRRRARRGAVRRSRS